MENRCPGCMKLKKESPVCEHCGYEETAANAPHQLPVGTVLQGKYRIGKVLGQGGFGITYLGWDLFLEIPVAVKEYYPSGMVMRESEFSLDVSSGGGEQAERFAKNRERFLREAKAIARLENIPQIVKVSNYFLDHNTAYIVMEYVEGITLKQHVKNCGGKLSPQETFSILRPILEALDNVHAAGLVHRDISPDNIMLLPGGGAKLIDFGAVRDVGRADADQPLSKSTEAILKQGYAPIEQYQKRGALGPWTDVYALCATIYYCLTGKVPMDAPERVLGGEGFGWEDIPGLTSRQTDALEKGMALLPRMRTASTKALAEELFADPTVSSPPVSDPIPDPVPVPPDPKPKPKRLLWIAAVLAVTAAVAIAAFSRGTKQEAAMQETPETAPETQMQISTAATAPTAETTAATEADLVIVSTESEDTRWEANVLKKDNIGSGETPVYGSRVRKSQIVSVTFYDTLAYAPSSCWDVSEAGDGSVMAWVSGNGQKYDLYLAAEGGINGIHSSENLFLHYANLGKVNFNGNYHTDQAKSLSNMFCGCSALTELDLSGFATAAAEDMSRMFHGCSGLTELDLSSFDTSAVTNMNMMFFGCKMLEQLDLSSFDTGNVVDMGGMFREFCDTAELDVSHFRTEKVRAYGQFMDKENMSNGERWLTLFE